MSTKDMVEPLSLEWLESVNPACNSQPIGHTAEAELRCLARVASVADLLGDSSVGSIEVVLVQDATFFAEIPLAVVGLIGSGPIPSIRFSRFESLCTVTMEHRLSGSMLQTVIDASKRCDFVYVSARLLGEPFHQRTRFNGDLFQQLFDYV